jgi:hypothetical protein
MTRHTLLLCSAALLLAAPSTTVAQDAPPRAIRRDIPLTNAIRRAHAAGTRDSTGRPGRDYWQPRTDYTISVRIDTATSRLFGRGTILVTNASPDTLRALRLRLDPNIFRSRTPHAAPSTPAEETDGMVITRLAVAGNVVPTTAAPGAGGRGGRGGAPGGAPTLSATGLQTTNGAINLATPVPPRGTVTVDIEWNHKLPGGAGAGHRMTQRWGDTLYQPTQWFPRLAKYDDLFGWDTELYLGPSEFYNNFGRFDVRIDAPAGWLVSATGVLQNPQEVLTPTARERLARVLRSDDIITIVGDDEVGPGRATATSANGRLVWHYVADTVNDFAWATAKKFNWQATRANIPTKGYVPVHQFFQPGNARLFANALPISKHALEFYSKLWFPYEFPQLTLQDGPSAGMEYPMVINSNAGAADHETAHMWWPMVVGNNETRWGWMDEGFNQYMNILSDADAAGRPPVLDGQGQSYGRRNGDENEAPLMWNANYGGPTGYGYQTYSKTPLMLSMLGGIFSDTAVQRAHREFGMAWRFKHPSPWDWMFSMQRSLGADLGWFWNTWLFTNESVDGALTDVTVDGGKAAFTVRQSGQMPSPIIVHLKVVAQGPALRLPAGARQVDATTIEFRQPVESWFDGRRAQRFELDLGGRTVEGLQLDPGRRFPDRDPSDNVWPRAATPTSTGVAR